MFKKIFENFKIPKKSIIIDLTKDMIEKRNKLEYEIFLNLKKLYGEEVPFEKALEMLEDELRDIDKITLGRLCELSKMKKIFEEYKKI